MPGLILTQSATRAPGGEVEVDDAMYLVAIPGGRYRIGLRGNGSDPSGTLALHGSTHHAGGSDALDLSLLAGTLGPTHGGTGLTTIPAGAVPYASALDTLAALPIGAAGTVFKSNGALPGWGQVVDADVAPGAAIGWSKVDKAMSTLGDLAARDAADLTGTLADARLSSNVPRLNSLNVFERPALGDYPVAFQVTGDSVPRFALTIGGAAEYGGGGAAREMTFGRNAANNMELRSLATAQPIVLRIIANNTVGGAGGTPELRFLDKDAASSTATTAGSFAVSLAGATTGRALQFAGGSDRDGTRLPVTLLVRDAAGTGVEAIRMFAGANAGYVALHSGRMGIGLGLSGGLAIAPSAPLHVVSTSAGALTEPVRIGNQNATTASAVGVAFHAAASGAQKIARVQAILQASSVGDLVLEAQSAAGAGPVERLRLTGAGPLQLPSVVAFPVANPPAGTIWIASVAGTLKAKGASGTITTLALP